jgi:hypothetical protein
MDVYSTTGTGIHHGFGNELISDLPQDIFVVIIPIVKCSTSTSEDFDTEKVTRNMKEYELLYHSLGSPLSEALPSAQDLQDGSKSDQLTKGLAILQTVWFIGQCISRAHHGLAISELEVGTVAFVACTFLAYLFWWAKTYGCQNRDDPED